MQFNAIQCNAMYANTIQDIKTLYKILMYADDLTFY